MGAVDGTLLSKVGKPMDQERLPSKKKSGTHIIFSRSV
jgi:hypothetical protein